TDGTLDKMELRWRPEAAVCVVMAAAGYPGTPAKGALIHGLAEADALAKTKVFQAGVARQGDRLVTHGGRVLGVTAWDARLKPARDRAYQAVAKIRFDGAQFRSDIGAKALRRGHD
ncbi:MAG: phosphoribosylglycinamide synthetase C domain-containing protein, partial [Verrucomicrobiota bacterium]